MSVHGSENHVVFENEDMAGAGIQAQTAASLERRFGELLGVERVLWLEHGGLDGDDTDGHVDMLARFCDEATLAYTQCRDTADSQYAELAAMERQLQAFRDRHGCPYRLVALPLPRPVRDADGRRLPASYANFYISNYAVLVPTFNDPNDRIALGILSELEIDELFPGSLGDQNQKDHRGPTEP